MRLISLKWKGPGYSTGPTYYLDASAQQTNLLAKTCRLNCAPIALSHFGKANSQRGCSWGSFDSSGRSDPGGGIVTLTVIGDCNWKLISVSV
jgi:hypothetical protein